MDQNKEMENQTVVEVQRVKIEECQDYLKNIKVTG